MANFTQPLVLTATAASTGPARPSFLPGTMNQVFFDDFTTTTTIEPSPGYSTSTGYNWYWDGVGNSSEYSVATTKLAKDVGNGATSGGANPSPAGGILTMTGGTPTNSTGFDSVPGFSGGGPYYGRTTAPDARFPNCWKHGYFEVYMQYAYFTAPAGYPGSQYCPGFWSWGIPTAASTNATGTGGTGKAATPIVEVDFVEVCASNSQYGSGGNGLTMHNWVVSGGNWSDTGRQGSTFGPSPGVPLLDSQWHTFGVWWQPNGVWQAYVDNVAVGGTLNSEFQLENQYQYLILGTAPSYYNWPMNVDYVRVYQ